MRSPDSQALPAWAAAPAFNVLLQVGLQSQGRPCHSSPPAWRHQVHTPRHTFRPQYPRKAEGQPVSTSLSWFPSYTLHSAQYFHVIISCLCSHEFLNYWCSTLPTPNFILQDQLKHHILNSSDPHGSSCFTPHSQSTCLACRCLSVRENRLITAPLGHEFLKGKAIGRDVEYGVQFGWLMVKLLHNPFSEGSCVKIDDTNTWKAWSGKKSAQGKYWKMCHLARSQIPNSVPWSDRHRQNVSDGQIWALFKKFWL